MSRELGMSREFLNKKRAAFGLGESAGASFFDEEQITLRGGDNFTWNSGNGNQAINTTIYIYTRLDQSTDDGGGAEGQLDVSGDYSFRDVQCNKDRKYSPPFMQCITCFKNAKDQGTSFVISSDKSEQWRRYADESRRDVWDGVNPDKHCEPCYQATEEEVRTRTLRTNRRSGGGGKYGN
jgi:hypothetical protein